MTFSTNHSGNMSFSNSLIDQEELVKKIVETCALYQDPSVIGVLENFVCLEMCHPQLYNIDANILVLKHYLMFKKDTKCHIIQNILIQALMHLPSNDFDLCLCQIPLQYQTEDPIIRSLIEIESLLQKCRFLSFWELLESDEYLHRLAETPDFKNAIRRFMAGVISLAYQTITFEDTKRLLRLDQSTDLFLFCKNHLGDQWICDMETGVITILKKKNSVAVIGNQMLDNRPLFSDSTLEEVLNAVKGC